MHQPEIFEKMNKPTRDGATLALQKYGHLIEWGSDNQDTIIDIGTGPGNVLMGIILPFFDGKFSKAFGTDVTEEMVGHCKKKYASEKNVEFLVLDILGDDDFAKKHGEVNHAVSTFVIHWLPDQPKGLRNIFNLLKPGGDFFTVHNHSSSSYEILKYMDKNEKWNKYFDNITQYIPFSQLSEQPEKDLRDMMEAAGFVDVMIDVVYQDMVKDSYDDMKTLISSTLRQIDRVPKELRMEYVTEYIDYGIEKGHFRVRPSGEVTLTFNLFIAYGKKPM